MSQRLDDLYALLQHLEFLRDTQMRFLLRRADAPGIVLESLDNVLLSLEQEIARVEDKLEHLTGSKPSWQEDLSWQAMTEDNAFLEAFAACTLPFRLWTHRAHIRMAFLRISRHGIGTAIPLIREGIQRYNAAIGVSAAYHDTMTVFWAVLVDDARTTTKDVSDFTDFYKFNPHLSNRKLPNLYYSPKLLLSEAARLKPVKPDLKPLPQIDERPDILRFYNDA